MGKIRGGVVGECKKEFETGIFAMLETSIKLAKGTVESPARSVVVEQVSSLTARINLRTFGCCCALVTCRN